jgi:hypothetical protein
MLFPDHVHNQPAKIPKASLELPWSTIGDIRIPTTLNIRAPFFNNSASMRRFFNFARTL